MLLAHGRACLAERYSVRAATVREQHGAVAEDVQAARNAARLPRQKPERRRGEERERAAGDAQAMLQILQALALVQRVDVTAHRDALGDLAEGRPRELHVELGLADEDDLQELVGVGFVVREQSQVFERLLVEVLGLVDDQGRGFTRRGALVQKRVERRQEIDAVAARAGLAEVGEGLA